MYLLDADKIEAGDIVLIRSDSEISKIVRKLTKSDYSHAMLYAGASSCIESDGNGVQSQNIQRILFEKTDDVKVFRLRKAEESKIYDALVFARQKVGTEYSLSEARAVLTHSDEDAKQPNRQFCTRFVAQSFAYAGINLVQNPDYCTPDHIIRSELLIEVFDTLKEARENEIEFANSESPLELQAKITAEIFKQCREISGVDIQNFPQLSKYVVENPNKENEINQVISKSGYLTMWKLDVERNPWHYDAEALIEHYTNPYQVVEVALFFATTESEIRDKFILNLNALDLAYKVKPLEYFKIQIELYKKLIELSLQREKTALQI